MDLRSGAITNDSRIRAAIPTIKYLIEHGARIILCTHLGRPKGKVIEELRTKPIASRLSQLLNLPVPTASDCIGPEVERAINELKEGDVLLLENIRFHPEEEANDPAFAKELASLADIYVNDAFGAAHRAHASTVGVAKHIPAVAGLLMEKELEILGRILTSPERPFAALLGGAKISDKIGLIQNILTKVDFLLIGGGMASVFLKATGYEIGASLVETDKQDVARDIVKTANQNGISICLPIDVVVAKDASQETVCETVSVSQIPPTEYIVDIGPKTIELFSQQLMKCRTVFWNGPMGIYEIPSFAAGTKAMANLLASIPATTVIGGGSTAEVVEDLGLADKMSHVSTGGGASLKFLEGERLPGVEVLLDK
jgi:phosphoglycerate kinase